MDKAYSHKDHEDKLYEKWEKSGAFSQKENLTPFTILMPPPNANASLHAGHAMYTVDDVLTRWKRMQGFDAQWIPGTDHAGFETQFVYEKNLAKEGKSRFDFDRKTLYTNVFNFVHENSGLIFKQMKKLGFSANWERSVFTLDKHVLKRVYETFKKMESEGKVYRDSYIVNYCIHDGTSLAELEVKHVDRVDPLYYIRYRLADQPDEFVVVATVRPEPIFADTHLAVNPKDPKNKHLIGKKVLNPLTDKEMEIISDEYVDPNFGTGVVKLTPAHDQNDFNVAKKHGLPIVEAINLRGKITENGGKYAGMKVKAAREEVVKDLQEKGLIEKIDDKYEHAVITCYKCGRDLEPVVVPNWFIKVEDLKKPVIEAVTSDRVKFYPKKFKRHMLSWLETMHDWPISRQIVWGIQIPAWYSVSENPSLTATFLNSKKEIVTGQISELLNDYSLTEITDGIQSITAPKEAKYIISEEKPEGDYIQETDTFDTWFSSGQWPLVTLKEEEFSSRYPTDFMGTLSDILKFWISRMIMFGLYIKDEVPFKDVYLWSMVADSKGVKMSKSKGNVINPIDLVEKYGADALRMSLLYGTPSGSKVILAEDKVRGMRNFSNKIWNASRYIKMLLEEGEAANIEAVNDEAFKLEIKKTVEETTVYLTKYKLDKAIELLYDKFWHYFCDWAIEESKKGTIKKETLKEGLDTFLKLLHPFAPFVTEASYQEIFSTGKKDLLITSPWPKA